MAEIIRGRRSANHHHWITSRRDVGRYSLAAFRTNRIPKGCWTLAVGGASSPTDYQRQLNRIPKGCWTLAVGGASSPTDHQRQLNRIPKGCWTLAVGGASSPTDHQRQVNRTPEGCRNYALNASQHSPSRRLQHETPATLRLR